MAHFLISTSLLKIISSRYAENAERPGKPPFPDVQGHFQESEDDLDCWNSRTALIPMAGGLPGYFARENDIKPSRFGICTFGSVCASITSVSPMMPFSWRI
jgi:hypothetical protein